MAYTCIDYRHYVATGSHKHPVSEIQKACGIQKQNWRRDFQVWHGYAWSLCDILDSHVLPVVARARVRVEKGKEHIVDF